MTTSDSAPQCEGGVERLGRKHTPWLAAAFKPAQGPRWSSGPGATNLCSPSTETSWDAASKGT